jgi:ribosomal protein S18 acetylase RimI-like enzyme
LRQAQNDDYDFLFSLHVKALRPYIEATWGWNEKWQEEYFAAKFDPANRQIIQVNGRDVGVFVVEERQDEMYLGLIELLPEYQNKGIGTAIVRGLVDAAGNRGLPLTLHVLKANAPAQRLYRRLGFTVIEEDRQHYKMRSPERP